MSDERPLPAEEPRDIFRLYRSEWCIVAATEVSDDEDEREQVSAQLREQFEQQFAGRVSDEHRRLTVHPEVIHLELFLPVLKGEFTFEDSAHKHAKQAGWDPYAVVERNTPADYELRNYGVGKLST